MLDKYTTGHIFAQERAGEAIGSGQGGAEAIKEFTDLLRSAVSPAVRELADTMALASHAGRIGVSAPGEFTQFQQGQGTAFAGNFTNELGFLGSSPYLNPIKNTFLANPFTQLTATDYLGNAEAAAMQGDYAGEKASFAFAETENDRNSENPAFRRDNDFVKRRDGESPWERGAEDLFEPTRVRAYNIAKMRLTGRTRHLVSEGNVVSGPIYENDAPENEYLPGYEDRKKTLRDAEKDIDDDRNVHIADEGKILFGASLLGRDTSNLSGALARGGGASAMNAYLGEMRFDTTGEIAALNEDAAKNFADAQKYTNPAQRNNFLAAAAGDQAKVAEVTANLDASAKSAFDMKFGEEQATFGLFATHDTLDGASAAQMQGGYDRQAEFLSGTAANPRNPLSPTERAGIEQSAEQMRYTAGRNVFQESMGWAGIREVQEQGQIGLAQTYGSPMDVYHADINQVGNEQNEVNIIDNRLKQNIPISERIPLTSQRQGIENDIAVAPERARVDAYNAEGSILSNTQAVGRSLLDRSVEVYGAKSFTPDIFAADQANVNLFTGAEQGSPLGSQQRAQFGRERADAQAQMQRDRDASYQFGNQATRVRDMQAEGEFDRAMKAPYLSGTAESDPFSRGLALESVYQGDLARAEAALKATPQSSPAYEANARQVESYKDKIADVEHDRIYNMFSALPESVVGGVGSGIMAGIVPTAAMVSRFTPNPLFGSWTPGSAPPAQPVGSTGAGLFPVPGGAAGGFNAAPGVATTEALLRSILGELQKGNRGTGGSAPINLTGAIGGVLGRSYNPARPPG